MFELKNKLMELAKANATVEVTVRDSDDNQNTAIGTLVYEIGSMTLPIFTIRVGYVVRLTFQQDKLEALSVMQLIWTK